MSTTKWTVGTKLAHPVLGRATADADDVSKQASLEANDWRAVDPPVDAPAEKRELTLAPGWRHGSGHWECTDAKGNRDRDKHPKTVNAVYENQQTMAGACEACAPSMGVFAPPAPAKTGCPAWCGLPYEHPDVPSEVVVFQQQERDRTLWRMAAFCSPACRDSARAKPAEPKPAPPEKAKREPLKCEGKLTVERSRHQGAVLERWLGFRFAKTSRVAMCDGCWLETEKERTMPTKLTVPPQGPTARIGTVAQVFGDFVGVLGARGMRQDETRFEVGLRGGGR